MFRRRTIVSTSGESLYLITGDACFHLGNKILVPHLQDGINTLILCSYAKLEGLHHELPEYLASANNFPELYLDPGRLDFNLESSVNAIQTLLPYTKVLKLNTAEFLKIFLATDVEVALKVCRRMHKHLNVVVTRGQDGCIVVPSGGGSILRLPVTREYQNRSLAGAGDAFFASLIKQFGIERLSLSAAAKRSLKYVEKFLASKNTRLSGY
jgi:sugar/nucleoside kinase (ribokinase family)